MASPPLAMALLIDEDIPFPVADFLRDRGHEIHLVKQSTFEGEPDEVIVRLADQISRSSRRDVIIVTGNHKHFVRLIARRPPLNYNRFRALRRISVRCNKAAALKRFRETIDDIEREYQFCQGRPDKRLIMTIDDHHFSIER